MQPSEPALETSVDVKRAAALLGIIGAVQGASETDDMLAKARDEAGERASVITPRRNDTAPPAPSRINPPAATAETHPQPSMPEPSASSNVNSAAQVGTPGTRQRSQTTPVGVVVHRPDDGRNVVLRQLPR